jgi:hypothetical protein
MKCVLTTEGISEPFDKECSKTGGKVGSLPPLRWHPGAAGQIPRQRKSRRFSTSPILGGYADRYPGPDTPVSDHPRGVR